MRSICFVITHFKVKENNENNVRDGEALFSILLSSFFFKHKTVPKEECNIKHKHSWERCIYGRTVHKNPSYCIERQLSKTTRNAVPNNFI